LEGAPHECLAPLKYEIRSIAVKEAMRHTSDEKALGLCRAVIALCERASTGEVSDAEWEAAGEPARCYSPDQTTGWVAGTALRAALERTHDTVESAARCIASKAWEGLREDGPKDSPEAKEARATARDEQARFVGTLLAAIEVAVHVRPCPECVTLT
jgi:hypothetical protein